MKKGTSALLVVGLAVSAFAAGCSSGGGEGLSSGANASSSSSGSSGGGSSGGGGTSEGPTGFSSFHPDGPAKTYFSGFDGTNDYVIPVAFVSDAPPKVTFGDAAIAEQQGAILTLRKSLAPQLPAELDGRMHVIMVKSKQAGQTTIHAVSAATDETATVIITAYSPGDVTVGKQRYEVGATACSSCHASLGVHSTSMLADLSDDTILGIAVEGKSLREVDAAGDTVTVQPNGGNHRWSVTTAERTGLMAYLRSRPLSFQLPTGK